MENNDSHTEFRVSMSVYVGSTCMQFVDCSLKLRRHISYIIYCHCVACDLLMYYI